MSDCGPAPSRGEPIQFQNLSNRPTFDAWTQPWIPALYLDGSRREVGLGEALETAHLIAELDEALVAVGFGLYRLLVALVMDVCRFEALAQLRSALDADTLDLELIGDYYAEHSGRFDLFDPHYPFLQTPATPEQLQEARSVAPLLRQFPAGTGATLFHHGSEEQHAWGAGVCARGLCAVAPFMTAGGAGYSPSINGAPPWYVLVRGRTLKETLLLNCWHRMDSGPYDGFGVPSWRRDVAVVAKAEQTTYSLMEGLTWQPRVICLVPGEGGVCTYTGQPSETLVRRMVFTPGLKAAEPENWRDPNAAYGYDEAGKRSKMMPRDAQEAWRNLAAFTLAKEAQSGFERPMVVTQLQQLMDDGYQVASPLQFECYGMRTEKVKIFEWDCCALTLDKSVFLHPQAGAEVMKAMGAIKQQDKRLRDALKLAYGKPLDAPSRELWRRLHDPFSQQFLPHLGQTDHGDTEELETLQARWKATVAQAGAATLEDYLHRLGLRPKARSRAAEATKIYLAGAATSVG